MKVFISIVCMAFLSLHALSQYNENRQYFTGALIITDPGGAGGNVMNGVMVDPSWKIRVGMSGDAWKGNEAIKGTIFYNDEMNKGYIKLEGDKTPRSVSLRYNIYSHEINFMQDKTELVLDASIPVHEFGYAVTSDDVQKNIVFRSGYPAVRTNTTKTFYEVIVDKDIALLKYETKKILEKKDERGAAEKVVLDSESWFIYDAASNSIAEIKKNKNALAEALPQYAGRIKEITESKGLKLKSDADWSILLDALAAK